MGDQLMSDRLICSLKSSDHRTRDPPNSSGISVVPETQLNNLNVMIDHVNDSDKSMDVASPGEHAKTGDLSCLS